MGDLFALIRILPEIIQSVPLPFALRSTGPHSDGVLHSIEPTLHTHCLSQALALSD